jgi:hypothetical protein
MMTRSSMIPLTRELVSWSPSRGGQNLVQSSNRGLQLSIPT